MGEKGGGPVVQQNVYCIERPPLLLLERRCQPHSFRHNGWGTVGGHLVFSRKYMKIRSCSGVAGLIHNSSSTTARYSKFVAFLQACAATIYANGTTCSGNGSALHRISSEWSTIIIFWSTGQLWSIDIPYVAKVLNGKDCFAGRVARRSPDSLR